MGAVYFIRSAAFDPLIKVCVTDCDEYDVLFAHKEIYGEVSVEQIGTLREEGQPVPEPFVTDEENIREMIDATPFRGPTKPLRVPRTDIWNICGADDDSIAISRTAPQKSAAQQKPAFFKLCSVIELALQVNETIKHRPVLITNRKFAYESHLLGQVFPEFAITVHDRFPENPLAERMLWYLIETHGPVSSESVIADHVERVQRFFGVGQNPVSLRTPSLSPTCANNKRLIVREFAAFRCGKSKGCRIKSSELFRHFESFYTERQYDIPFSEAFTITQFSQMMKTNSVFRTKRRKDGMYWENLQILDIPVTSQACAGFTFVNFDIRGSGKSLSISELFAN